MEQIKGKFSFGSSKLDKLLEYYVKDEYVGFYTPVEHKYVGVKLYQIKDGIQVKYQDEYNIEVRIDWIAIVSYRGHRYVVGLEAYEWDVGAQVVDRNTIGLLAYSLLFTVYDEIVPILYVPLDTEQITLIIEKE